jgi:hypothetical protein
MIDLCSSRLKTALKKRHDFALGDPEKYMIFLKRHFTSTTPKFWSVIEQCQVLTRDGMMYALALSEDIENPNYDTIAECVINGDEIYLWNDRCWGVAEDEGRPLSSLTVAVPTHKEMTHNRKTVLLYRIGTEPVE